MPLLRNARDFEQNADPGTRQWEIQNAFRRKSNDKGEEKGKDTSRPKEAAPLGSSYLDIFDRTLLGADTSGDDCEDDDDDSSRPLPEDAFHSQDILSKHLLKKQEEERNAQKQKNISREGADVEHVDYFKPEKMLKNEDETTTRGDDSSLLSKAEEVLKQNLPESCHQIIGSHLALGLV
jgi:uncharacterized protein YkuJ